MKFCIKHYIALLSIVAVTYSSCNKVQTKPASSNENTAASQLSLSLYKSLTGQYGGNNINDGVKATSAIHLSVRKTGANTLSSSNNVQSLCGYTIDTAYNYSVAANDTTKTFTGTFKFVNTCSASTVDGYSVYDTVSNTEQGTKFINNYINAQYYTVQALDKTYKLVSANGYIFAEASSLLYATATAKSQLNALNSKYYLTALTIDVTSGTADITGGTSTFNASINSPDGTITSYQGTLVFLGNHQAKITFSTGKSYMVNMLTGQVTAI